MHCAYCPILVPYRYRQYVGAPVRTDHTRTAHYQVVLSVGVVSALISTIVARYRAVSIEGEGRRGRRKRKNLESDVVLWRHLDLLPPSLAASLTHVASTTLATFHPRGGKKPQRRYWYVDRPLPGGTAKN
ncbi:hypothetical protein BHM03_00048794 [Ensete ventricosum]|nr:hypothetical protein BHM03_00048794 [Ensete ventricosum]